MANADKKFRILLFQLSQRMNKSDIEAIVLIEKLQADIKEQSALSVLMKLEMLGRINESNPSTVEQIFRNIDREDLANDVKKFKKGKSKKIAQAPEEDMLLKLRANLEVTTAQHRLLLDQLKEFKRLSESATANELTGVISQVTHNTHCNMETLLHAKDLLRPEDVLSDSSTESENSFQPPPASSKAAQQGSFDMRELQQSVLKRKDPRESSPPSPLPRRIITPVQEESLYAEVAHTQLQLCVRKSNGAIGQFSSNNPPPPRSPGNSGRRGSSLLVAEQSGKSPAVSRKTAVKPAPPPKPTPPPRPPKPSQTKQREAQAYVPVVVEEEEDSTAGTTGGDSGFSEASDFLRVNLPSPHLARVREEPRASNMATPAVSTAGYMPIQKEQVQHVSYYKSSNRQQQFQKYLDVYTEGDTASTTKGSGNGSTNTL